MFQNEWIPNTTYENKVVYRHPHLEEIRIITQGVKSIASPFKTINTKEDETITIRLKYIKGIQQQNNFTNKILGTISSKLYRIEKNTPKTNEIEKGQPLLKPIDCKKSIRLGSNKNNDDLVQILTNKL